jgi:DNA-binding MarR family transcriptional regulator
MATAANNIDRYLADGLIERSPDADRKGRWYRLTAKGIAEAERSQAMRANLTMYATGIARRPPRPLENVEVAAEADYDGLMVFLSEVRTEIGDGCAVDGLLLGDLARSLTRRDGGIVFVIKGQRGIEGSLGIQFARPWYTRQFRLQSVWNVVLPEFRGTTAHARSLLIEAQKFADRLGRALVLEELTQRLLETKAIDDPKLRLCGRNLRPAGMIFAHLPATTAA